MSSVKFVVGFFTIKCRGNITSNYKELANLLTENGYECTSFSEYPITRESLAQIDVFVIPCPDNNRITPNEIKAIKTWVAQDGGGLLLLSHAGGDKGRRSNLSEISEKFGMIFENNQVLDKYTNLGVENLPLITEFSVPHPIVANLSKVCFRAGCSLTASGINVAPVIVSGPKADPFDTPLLLATEDQEGRVVSVGSYEMFRDKITGGMRQDGHAQLALNIFSWLQTTRREQIRLGVAPSLNNSLNRSENDAFSTVNGLDTSNTPNYESHGFIQPQTYDSNVKILGNEDLFNAFEQSLTGLLQFKQRVLQEFEILETNLTRLMKAVLASEEDIIRFRSEQSTITPEQSFDSPEFEEEFEPEDEEVADILSKISQIDNPNGSPSNLSSNSMTTTMESSTQRQVSPIVPVVISKPPEKTAPPEPKTPEELEEEMTNLVNKLNSIKNLRAFVEKKFTAGKLNQKRYDKQIEKLESDSKDALQRIEEIKKLLAS